MVCHDFVMFGGKKHCGSRNSFISARDLGRQRDQRVM